jgi:hypothetical protein
MIPVIEKYLLTYACVDFLAQIIGQLPIVQQSAWFEYVGFRKIW